MKTGKNVHPKRTVVHIQCHIQVVQTPYIVHLNSSACTWPRLGVSETCLVMVCRGYLLPIFYPYATFYVTYSYVESGQGRSQDFIVELRHLQRTGVRAPSKHGFFGAILSLLGVYSHSKNFVPSISETLILVFLNNIGTFTVPHTRNQGIRCSKQGKIGLRREKMPVADRTRSAGDDNCPAVSVPHRQISCHRGCSAVLAIVLVWGQGSSLSRLSVGYHQSGICSRSRIIAQMTRVIQNSDF